MKIALVGPVHPFRGGIAHFTTALANAACRNHSVEVVSFRRLYPAILYPGQSDRDHSQSPIALESRVTFSIDTLNPLTWVATARRIASPGPDLVVLPWWTTYLGPCLGSLARMLRGRVPVVYIIHNVLPHEPGVFDRTVAQWALRPARGFAVLTEREKTRLSLLLPNRKEVAVSRHPVYRQFESDQVDPEAARLRLGVPPDRPVVLFFGFIRPYKGVEFLVDAVGRLRDRGQTPTLLIAGEGWGASAELRQQVESLGMTDQVRIHNRYIPNEEVGLYFSAADVFVAPYTAGTQSGSLQIAAGYSLPVVVTEHLAPGLHRIPSDRARVVPTGDAGALAGAIQEMLRVPRLQATPPSPDDGWDSLTKTLLALGGLADRSDAR